MVRLARRRRQSAELVGAKEEPRVGLGEEGGGRRVEEGGFEAGEREGEVLRLWVVGQSGREGGRERRGWADMTRPFHTHSHIHKHSSIPYTHTHNHCYDDKKNPLLLPLTRAPPRPPSLSVARCAHKKSPTAGSSGQEASARRACASGPWL